MPFVFALFLGAGRHDPVLRYFRLVVENAPRISMQGLYFKTVLIKLKKTMKKASQIIAATLALAGSLPDIKLSAKDRRELGTKPKATPPRSMSDEELEYYKKHKTLNGYR